MQRITTFWNKGWMGKVVLSFVGLLLACCVFGILVPRRTPAQPTAPRADIPTVIDFPTRPPTDVPATPEPTDVPTVEVLATLATDVPAVPTAAPQPTTVPAVATKEPALAIVGAAPRGSDCPADHPIKGNIRDRNPNKGEKIYHVPGDNGFAQTKPERCFADVAEAEAAGFRPVK
jgi:hypothetical protein